MWTQSLINTIAREPMRICETSTIEKCSQIWCDCNEKSIKWGAVESGRYYNLMLLFIF